jgi:aminopeptidase N
MVKLFSLIAVLSMVMACSTQSRYVSKQPILVQNRIVEAPTIKTGQKPLIPTAPLNHVMKHLQLHVGFDYNNQTVLGRAFITFSPHFYNSKNLLLDAKMFVLHRLAIIQDGDTIDLKYTYNNEQISITLDREYTRDDEYVLYVHYTAQPNKIVNTGAEAITDAKGLYFINPAGKEPNKPRQIWTQGEPECNSGWIPIIDKPNQKYTQELYITVEQKDVTLSNGELMWSKEHDDGTRTDYWIQNLPHAPYLTMICIGEFQILKDYWRDSIEVNYFLEKDYAPYAYDIFGKTPQMIEFYSKRLGVDFPWQKYSQVVVRDFVSGAMENTSAVIHYEGVQRTRRELIDMPQEDIIAHELLHHWFGDLVTCESWNNITLNESFATYGEYLWHEWDKGRDVADYIFQSNLYDYLARSAKHDESLFRRYFHKHTDVFDVVSYQKGSRVLHMLRYHIGDEAFFESIKRYLNTYAFGTAEVHQLRLIIEEVTGLDMNWFFNQWYFNSGHPDLLFNYSLSGDKKQIDLTIQQLQDTNLYGLFVIPLAVDIYTDSSIIRKVIKLSQAQEVFSFSTDHTILNVNVDAEKLLLAKISDIKPIEMWMHQWQHAPLLLDKIHAIENLEWSEELATKEFLNKALYTALDDTFYVIKRLALEVIKNMDSEMINMYAKKLIHIIEKEWDSYSRYLAIASLARADAKQHANVFKKSVGDSSYRVMSEALQVLHTVDPISAQEIAKNYENNNNRFVVKTIISIYASTVDTVYFSFFANRLDISHAHWQLYAKGFVSYLRLQPIKLRRDGIAILKQYAANSSIFKRTIQSSVQLLRDDAIKQKNDLALRLKKEKNLDNKAEIVLQALELDILIKMVSDI